MHGAYGNGREALGVGYTGCGVYGVRRGSAFFQYSSKLPFIFQKIHLRLVC